MNKKGIIGSVIIFFAIMIGVFIISIVILKLSNSILGPMQTSVGNVSETAGTNVGYIKDTFANWWDYVIVLLFLLNVILLFISAFLVDINPAFLFLYIIALIFLFSLGTAALEAMDTIWSATDFSTEAGQLPITQFLVDNFAIVMLGVVILSGVIMYAKFKINKTGQNGY